MTAKRIRKIRRALGLSQGEFARTLWVTYSTLSRWERGLAVAFGMPLEILTLLEWNLASRTFKAALNDPRSADPLFLLYRLLQQVYGKRGGKRATPRKGIAQGWPKS
jgi:transcriptional regulator with XRE-family HTH domain